MRLNRLLRSVRPSAQSGVGSSEAGDRHPEGGAGDVVETDLVAEYDRFRITPMFPADAKFYPFPGASAQFAGHFYQFADAVLVERDKRVFGKQIRFHIERQELSGVVA